MKAMTSIFWAAVAGVGISLCIAVYLGIQNHRAAKIEAARPITIPTPAMPSH